MARTPSSKRKTKPLKSTTAPAARAPSIRGEKRVRETEQSVPVAPARRRRGAHDGPTDPAAIDRRKEFVGTDQPARHRTPGKRDVE
jgi:hypothetical protein